MKHLDYEIGHYRPELRDGVVRLLGQLRDGDDAANERFFAWKYERNPHAEHPLGIVALHRGRVVGFRGYGPARWHTGQCQPISLLVPGDTCVDANHRQKGLSVAMGQLATADYAAGYRLFLNLSCTRDSLPGYLRLGFAPLADKVYLSRYGSLGLARYLLASKIRRPIRAARIRYGEFGDVTVSAAPLPTPMASVIARQAHAGGRFHLCQEEDFFRWRFAGPSDKFVFYFRRAGDDTVAYLAVAVTAGGHRGYVIDHADSDGESCGRLFEFAAARGDFKVLSVFAHSLGAPLAATLRRNGFHADGIMGALEKRVRGNLPILVRPLRAEPAEADWFIDGQDVREKGNWAIKGVCSDST
jgi:hypothetical protein